MLDIQRKPSTSLQSQSAHLLELTLADPIPVEDDAMRLEAGALVELDEHLSDHGGQLRDDLLPVLLDTHGGAVATGVGIHAGYQLEKRGRTSHIRTCVLITCIAQNVIVYMYSMCVCELYDNCEKWSCDSRQRWMAFSRLQLVGVSRLPP